MKVIQINTFPNKATGSIMMNLHNLSRENGIESYVVWGRGRQAENKYEISIEDKIGVKYHGIYTRVTDKTGFASFKATKKLLNKLDIIKPDIIHLHNLHGYYININLLFNYIKERQLKVIWTLHDCWPFTGHCAYFDRIECDKWKYMCDRCPQKQTYPSSFFFDNSRWNYQKKKDLFSGLELTIVTPSQWLAEITKLSFLNKYDIKVIYNGIDLNVYKPVKSSFRQKYSIQDKTIILGVASEWTERKGLKDFIKMSNIMDDSYQFVVVGLSKKQIKKMPKNFICLQRTKNVQELVEIYSAADIFFNPTYEDNFPTTNIESLACGTPIITYDTGGSPESIQLYDNIGYKIDKINSNCVDYYKIKTVIEMMAQKNSDLTMRKNIRSSCREAAYNFDLQKRLMEYVELYYSLNKKN